MQNTFTKIQTTKWFFLFCLAHFLIWTLLPVFFRAALPHDVAEGVAWGMQWQWGYYKHPSLTAWLCASFVKLTGQIWPVYVFAQLAIITAFYAIWRLSSAYLQPIQALMSVFLLEGIVFFNTKTENITPDTMQTPVWALVMLTFYNALTKDKYWGILGFLCGLAFLAKYSAVLLFAAMVLVFFVTKEGRQCLVTRKPYFALLVFILTIAPHLIWTYHSHFLTLTYANDTIMETKKGHVLMPLDALIRIIITLIPLFLMLTVFYKKNQEKIELSLFQKQYLFIMGLAPFALTLAFSMVTGTFIHHRWLAPCYLLLGLIAVVLVQPSAHRFKPFITIFCITFLLIPVVRYSLVNLTPYFYDNPNKMQDSYFPAREIAQDLTRDWHKKINKPLRYIAGENYLTAYFSVYSEDKPLPFLNSSYIASPWINKKDLIQNGAMFIWPAGNEEYKYKAMHEALAREFPTLLPYTIKRFKQNTKAVVSEVSIAVAILPPAVKEEKEE